MKKKFPLHAILTMRTEMCMGDFGKAHELMEWVLGHPVWTHEMLSYRKSIEAELAKQFPKLPGALPHVTKENYATVLSNLEGIHGKELEVEQGFGTRDKNPLETAIEMFGEDRVMPVSF